MLKNILIAVFTTLAISVGSAASSEQLFKSGYSHVNGLAMYYERHGVGKPVVVLHGAYMSTESMQPLVNALARNHEVIAVDLQGHGRTGDVGRPITYEQMADDVSALMKDIGVPQADIFGYSMGAGVAFQLAIRHPVRVRHLAAASVTINTDGIYPSALAGVRKITPAMFAGSPWESEYMRQAPNKADWPKLIEKLKTLDLTPQAWPASKIAGITVPTLIISGDADIIRPEHSVAIFRLRGGGASADFMSPKAAELAILPGTTHLGVLQRLDLIVPIVSAFFERAAN